MCRVHNKYHKTAPDGAVYIGRPSKWGNPYNIGGHGSREEVIYLHKQYVLGNPELMSEIKNELKGKDLICFCAPKACHGDILISIANSTHVQNHEKSK